MSEEAKWIVKFSNTYKIPYFLNTETRESQWEVPEDIDEELKQKLKEEGEKLREQNKQDTPKKIRASHILVKHAGSRRPKSWKDENITRSEDEARETLKGIEQQLNSSTGDGLIETFGKIAETESDCASHARRGDLGFFERGAMQKPFEDAAFALEKGAMSPIVSTDSGVHLILRTA